MSTGTLAPTVWTVTDSNGDIVPGAKIYTYLAGTSTTEPVYTDSGLSVAHPNPVVCDSAGRATIYLDAKSYRFVVNDADDAALYTLDPVQGVQTGQTNLGEIFHFGGDEATSITATSYASGATADKLHVGTAIYNVNSANLPAGTYKLEGMVKGAGSATVTAAIMNLTDGSPDTALATISSNDGTGVRAVSGAITFAAAGAAKDYGIKVKVSASSGYAWGIRLIRTA